MDKVKAPRRERARLRLIKIVNARYSVPTWLWVVASTVAGVIILVGSLTLPAATLAADPFLSALPINGIVWGGLLTASGFVNMYGMARLKLRVVKWTAFICFCLWVFGVIAFWLTGVANVALFAGPMLSFWAYKYIASHIREQNNL